MWQQFVPPLALLGWIWLVSQLPALTANWRNPEAKALLGAGVLLAFGAVVVVGRRFAIIPETTEPLRPLGEQPLPQLQLLEKRAARAATESNYSIVIGLVGIVAGVVAGIVFWPLAICVPAGILMVVVSTIQGYGARANLRQIEEAISKQSAPSAASFVAPKTVEIGMSAEAVRDAWGEPTKVDDKEITAQSRRERWVYGSPRVNARYIWFVDGIVTKIKTD